MEEVLTQKILFFIVLSTFATRGCRHYTNEIPHIRETGLFEVSTHIVIKELQVTNIEGINAGRVDPEHVTVIYEEIIKQQDC